VGLLTCREDKSSSIDALSELIFVGSIYPRLAEWTGWDTIFAFPGISFIDIREYKQKGEYIRDTPKKCFELVFICHYTLNGTLCSSKLMLAVWELLECCEVLFNTIRLLFL
jgi:hypothetical protein